MRLERLRGPETGIAEAYATDWDAHGIAFYEDVVYGQGGGHDLYLDLMVPESASKNPRPVVVWIHGGGWTTAELTKKYRTTPALVALCQAGFVCASIDYRLVTEQPFPAPIEDCKCAVRFLKAHAQELHIDPERIGLWGESAGGQLAALVGVSYGNPRLEGRGGWQEYSSDVRAVCDWYFGGDMTHMGASQVPEVQERAKALGVTLPRAVRRPPSDGDRGPIARLPELLFGMPAKDAPQLSMDISPIFYVDQELPPFLLMHGDSDETVPVEYSYQYYDALLSHGHDATFVVVPRQGHGFFTGQGYYDIVHNFFVKHLF